MNREWTTLKEYEDYSFEFYNGIARITINRPQVRNAFTPRTVSEMSDALYICRDRRDVRVVVLTGAGDKAFCSGGDMHVKGHGGYVGDDGVPRLKCVGGAKNKSVRYPSRDCGGQRLCHRRRPRAPCGVRPDDSFGQCRFRTDRSARREF